MLRLIYKFRKYSTNVDINKSLMDKCKECEERPIRQEALYNNVMNNIDFSENNDLINISKLNKNTSRYHGSPLNVLSSLYNYGIMITNNKPRNIFSLPLERCFSKVNYNQDIFKNDISIYEILIEKYKENIKNNDDLFKRHFLRKDVVNRIYLKKDDDYDSIKLEFLNKDINGNTVDEKFIISKKNQTSSIHIVEIKNPKHIIDIFDISEILEISKTSNYYINNLNGIFIRNKFDGNHVYNMKNYDQIYGIGSFIKALVPSFCISDPIGNVSIKHQQTIDIIKNISFLITNDKNLSEKISNDLINNSIHSYSDVVIDISEIMKSYCIEGYELLCMMKYRNKFDNLKDLQNYFSKIDNSEFDYFKQLLNKKNNYIYYIDNVPIRNTFIRNRGDSQLINIHNYDKNKIKFYECILLLMYYKIFNINIIY